MPVEVCKVCGERKFLSRALGVCVDCIRERSWEALRYTEEGHREARRKYGLPESPPRGGGGVKCTLCANECSLAEGEVGYCGLRWNENGKIVDLATAERAILYAYKDPHITNCCSAWICPAIGLGYPKYAVSPGPEYGYYNLAVFFYGCNFNCLFCQNYEHKEISHGPMVKRKDLVERTVSDRSITCICFFGGSPEPSFPFAIAYSEEVLERCRDRVMRICWEWNGCGNKKLALKAAELSFVSGGNVKFDLKCYTEALCRALCGVPNRRAFENFKAIYKKFYEDRKEVPVLTATTLLVPGYVDAYEVERIAAFIADLNPEIPYSLLIFHPQFKMRDLPITPSSQVFECYLAAKKHLEKVHVGNLHLIGISSMNVFEELAKKYTRGMEAF
ncbi:MAG: radical SAM protein [Candidatus Verstraetearchaeota archaeon]|nr:radical SAM protein [Candidatus Verstraetearchaeota archaeon]